MPGAASARPLDRVRLAEVLDFLAAVRPLVKAGFLTIAPIGNTPDPSSPLPLLYSPSAFEDGSLHGYVNGSAAERGCMAYGRPGHLGQ